MSSVQEIVLGKGTNQLSALYAPSRTEKPRGIIFSIHGGSYGAEYFHLEQDSSLMTLGSDMGYAVISINRPGYGIATDRPKSFDEQAKDINLAIEEAIETYGKGVKEYFIVGHSIGAMIAMIAANQTNSAHLLGLDLSGAGLEFHEQTKIAFRESVQDGYVQLDDQVKAAVMYGPEWTRTSQMIEKDVETFRTSIAEVEIAGALDWDERVKLEAPQVKVPVHFVLAEHDNIWKSSPEIMNKINDLFTSVPFSNIAVQRFTGHCNHLHTLGKAYSLRTLAFIEESLLYCQKKEYMTN